MRFIYTAIFLMILMGGSAVADELLYAFNAGGTEVYDSHGNLFQSDLAYEPGGAGYDYGFPTIPAYVPNISPWTTDDFELQYRQRRSLNGYHFDLPPGDYVLRLYFLDGLTHGPRLRLMDISIEGVLLFDDLDLVAETSFMGAYERSFLVTVEDGTLDVEFQSVRQEALLSAIAVWSMDDTGLAPRPPSNVSLEASYGMNILRWETEWDPGIDEVEILRSESLQGPYEVIDSMAYHRRYYLDRSVVGGTTHYYKTRNRDVWNRVSVETPVIYTETMSWDDIGVPVFHLNIAETDLDSLNFRPFLDEYYDVGWAFDDNPFRGGDGRYRGGMARYFDKKSWKIKPGVTDAFEDLDVLTFITNPDDNYLIRNHVTMEAYDVLPRVWNSDVYWTALVLNGEYRGVADLTEAVDEEFLIKRGEDPEGLGNLYKAYGSMHILPLHEHYVNYYEFKAGPGDNWADLIEYIEGLHYTDEFDIGPWLETKVDLTNFYDYYAMIVYTRQYDFIVRNYYLYHSPDSGLWSMMPWDLSLSFWPEPLPLDFGTSASPHFWDNTWNSLIDRILTVPRLRWEYVKRLEDLTSTVLNGETIVPVVEATYDEIAIEGKVDPYRPFFATGEYFDIARSYISYRVDQRDDQFDYLIPEFKDEITTVSVNELQVYPGAVDPPWVELYNYGEVSVDLSGFQLEADSTVEVLSYVLLPGEHYLFSVDEGGVPGSVINPEGGTLSLLKTDGRPADQLRYFAAQENRSEGRSPDGWINWTSMFPSYGTTNGQVGPPVIRAVEFTPAQASQSDTLHFHAQMGTHPRPYTLNLHVEFSDSTWILPMEPEATDSTNWTVSQDPLEEGGALFWYIESQDEFGLSSTHPASAPTYRHEELIVGGLYAIFLNEFMADNATTIFDEFNEYEDWIEIYNAGDTDFDLAGFTLSDNMGWSSKWTFPVDPASVVPAGGYILVWADEDLGQGPLHANFKLSRFGEEIGLFQPDGTPIDAIEFTVQAEDASFGRVSDGDEVWEIQIEPTPLAANAGGISTDTPEVPALFRLDAYPNPFHPVVTLRFNLPESARTRLEIFDLQGRRVALLAEGTLDAGEHEILWRGLDDKGRRVATGVYLAQVQAGDRKDRFKLLLLK